MSSLKIIFAGTPEFAACHLRALLNTEHEIIGVYTQPDRPAGRGKKLTPSAVKEVALQHNIPVFQPASLKGFEAQEALASLGADLMVVVAYGLLLPQAVLDAPRLGCINVHGSILPRWRGAAPIQRAIEAGDKTSGVTIMQMDIGLDTGDMLLKRECNILPTDTSADLHDRLCEIGPPALIESLKDISEGNVSPEKQDDALSNYAKKIEKAEAEINWNESSDIIVRKILAFNPFPVAYSTLNGERLKIQKAKALNSECSKEVGQIFSTENDIRVQARDGQIIIETLQLPGKKAMSSADFLNGFSSMIGGEKNSVVKLGNCGESQK